MNWAHRQRYAISPFALRASDPRLTDSLFGLVCPVCVRFQFWHPDQSFPAYAYIDGGSDFCCMSLLWLARCRQQVAYRSELYPAHNDGLCEPDGQKSGDPNNQEISRWLQEGVTISIAGKDFTMPPDEIVLKPQWNGMDCTTSSDDDPFHWNRVVPMPGCEDILLGRNFMRRHKILLVDNPAAQEFCLLCPTNDPFCRYQQIVNVVQNYPLRSCGD